MAELQGGCGRLRLGTGELQYPHRARRIRALAARVAQALPWAHRDRALQGAARKAWKIVGKASALGEEVYIMDGAYYRPDGRILAGPGTFMFNAPGAVHGGISCDLTLFIHCCSGEPDQIVSVELIDFAPLEPVPA
jgi:hypothetical protein